MKAAMVRRWTPIVLGASTAVLAAGCKRSSLPARGDGSAVVLASPDAAALATGPVVEEREPNDTPARAQRVDVPDGGLWLTGSFGSPDAAPASAKPPVPDTDLFRLQLPGVPPAADAGAPGSPWRLFVVVEPAAGRAVALQLHDARAQPLASATGVAGEPEGFPNLAVGPGASLLLRLRSLPPDAKAPPSATTYRLRARLVAPEAGDEIEPNGDATRATELSGRATDEVAGFFGWRKDEDWYRVPPGTLAEGMVLTLELDSVDGVSAGLAVVDGAGRSLAAAHGRPGERVVLRNLRLPSAPAGVRDAGAGAPSGYVVVKADRGRNLDTRYVLRLRADLAERGNEVEPNDDPARAMVIEEGPTRGTLGPGDVDVFRFEVPEAATLDVDVTPPEGVDVRLEVLRAADGASLGIADKGTRRVRESLHGLAVAGPILVKVSSVKSSGNTDESYELRVTRAAAPAPGPASP